jgi:IS1 family transposase
MPTWFMTNWSLFPPQTEEVQLDEKWSFVLKKDNPDELEPVKEEAGKTDPVKENGDKPEMIRNEPVEPAPSSKPYCGDNWDHVAFDPEHRLVLKVVNGKRSHLHVREVLESVDRIMEGRIPRLVTSDEFSSYYSELLLKYGVLVQRERKGKRGRFPKPRLEAPEELLYATVRKTREKGRATKIETQLQFGTEAQLAAALEASQVSNVVNTSFIERHNGTDRNRNKRKARRTYCFSKDWNVHNAMTKYTMYSYNFCCTVRTLRIKDEADRYAPRTPAMAAGLADHVWSIDEWATYPIAV